MRTHGTDQPCVRNGFDARLPITQKDTHNTTGKDMKQDISPSFINDITINQLVNLLIKLWIAQFLVALFLGFFVMGASLIVLLITSLLGLGL